jgi:lipopolysaccharide assembly outer membrane protein LptD (OstA)
MKRFGKFVAGIRAAGLVTLIALLAAGQTAQAQQSEASTPAKPDEVDFSAEALDYDTEADIVTASGDVRMTRDGNQVRADKVVWNRKTGDVEAIGNVRVTNPGATPPMATG